MGQSPYTHTAPSSSSGPGTLDSGLSSSSTVTGLNLVRRSPQYRDGVQEGAGRVEHFVIIGTDVSIARCLHAPYFVVLSFLVFYCLVLCCVVLCCVVLCCICCIVLYSVVLFHTTFFHQAFIAPGKQLCVCICKQHIIRMTKD